MSIDSLSQLDLERYQIPRLVMQLISIFLVILLN